MNLNELSKRYSEEYCIKVELSTDMNHVHLWIIEKGITFNYSQLIDKNSVEELDEWVYNCISKEGFNKEYIRKQRKLKLDRIKQ